MADQQPAEATTDPPTTVTEDERAYRMPNSTWHMPSGHMQPPAITDTGYHMPQVTVSPAWGGSSHLPPLLPADGYGTRMEPGHRTSIHSGSYTQGGLETGDSYGSTYQLDSFRRLGVGYRVSGAIQPARPGIVPGDYARTCLGQGSYTRNYVSTYSDTRTNCEHGSHYRTITEPNDYSRANVEQNNYGRSQTGSDFYVRGNPLSASFDSESGTRIDNEQEMPRDDQASSTLSAVISCSRMYNSQDDKIPDNGDARCYSGSADTMTEISLTSLEAASKSDPNLSHDARVSTRAESELESSYQTENVAKLNHSSVSRMDGTCCDMRSPSGLENSCHGSPQADVDVNASHISGQKQRELEVTLNANGDLASRSMPCKDLSDEMSVSQKNEIQLFINDNPGMSLERIAEQFSKKWNMDLTSNAIHQVVGEGENKVQDLSEEMKNAIMSYKQEHQNSSFRDMANYFSKKWCMMLNKDVIASVLSEHSPEVDLVANENSNNEDAKEKPNCLEDELEISCEKKRELILFKTSHCSSSAEEMASYFSEKWNASISKETVLSILNGSENQTSDSSQNIEHSPQHQHSSSPSCSPKDKSTVSSNDISGEASHYGGYDNNIAKLVPVTVEEAREGLMKAIAYFMANPSIADGHVHTLWNILHYIDSQDESTVLSEKDPISADESSPHDSYAEIVNIKQELSEAECNADAFSENVKTEAFHMSTKSGSCQLIKVRSPVNSKRASIRRKLTKKKRVMSVKNSSKDKKDPLENEISINNVKVDVDQRLRCPDCDENFVEFTQLMDHITKHSEEKLILSHSCGDGLHLGNKSPVSRSRTRGQGHGRHRYVMGENTSQNLRDDDNPGTSVKHKRRIKLQNCMQCGRQFNDYSNFRRHLRLHAGLKPHKCSTCGLSFIESNALKKHMRTHTGEKPYLCTTCGKRVTTLAGLQSHARLHTGEKPFKCTICAKDFAQSSSLKRHMVIHTGERPYGCLQCGKNFPRSEDLKMHIRTHTGLKPYKCLVCGKCFIKSSYLHKHARIHTGEKPYKCTTCGEAFAQSDVLAKHIRVHTGERPYCCTACGKTFTQSGSLHHHMKMHKQHDLSPQRRKAPFSLSNQTEKNPDNLSESVTTLPDGEPVKFPALTQRLSNSSVTAQMTVFPNTSRPYLSQWRPY